MAQDGIRFCFIKATEGTADGDPNFADNRVGAAAAGILRGAYHFFRPGQDAQRQADHFLSVASLDPKALPPALDIEVSDGVDSAGVQSGIRTWVETVCSASGCKPILYADPSFWRDHVGADFSSYPLWLACYGQTPEIPSGWQAWTFWQHADSGNVNGITGRVDLDYCVMPEQRLRQMLGDPGTAACPADVPNPGDGGIKHKIEGDIDALGKLL